MALGIAVCLRTMMRQGITPATRLVAIGSPDPLHLTRRVFGVFQAGREGAPSVSVVTPVREMVRALNAYRPEAIIGYPTIAGILAEEQLEGRLDIGPRILAFGSEPVTEDIVRRVVAAWGVRPANVYATTEAPIVASSSPEDPCLDVADDLALVEIVDADGRPVPPGTPGERVLVTNLASRAVPLIRYELGDVVTPADGPSPAGRPTGAWPRWRGAAPTSCGCARVTAERSSSTASGSAAPSPLSPACASSSSAATSTASASMSSCAGTPRRT
jgi:phenylacetate-CoA ligase